ncbi:hypothetical protein N7478_006525 [Penicillium angulare]|uniref:uncharacterized protein n=1 Tax=Penicillium angulare TaxID=116970 RepID=UPI0025406B16|nr:uncharacterized protein N7478_006525 [Penicillium angulare]KAJ5281153.1 hypothetical protein N7478_006525 [Penicillium angulare]
MTVPLAIKIGDPQPFQVTLSMTTLREYTSPIIQDVAQKVQFNWVKWSLKCITNVPVNNDDLEGEQDVSHELNIKDTFQELEYPLVTTSTGGDSEPIHIIIRFNSVFIQVV